MVAIFQQIGLSKKYLWTDLSTNNYINFHEFTLREPIKSPSLFALNPMPRKKYRLTIDWTETVHAMKQKKISYSSFKPPKKWGSKPAITELRTPLTPQQKQIQIFQYIFNKRSVAELLILISLSKSSSTKVNISPQSLLYRLKTGERKISPGVIRMALSSAHRSTFEKYYVDVHNNFKNIDFLRDNTRVSFQNSNFSLGPNVKNQLTKVSDIRAANVQIYVDKAMILFRKYSELLDEIKIDDNYNMLLLKETLFGSTSIVIRRYINISLLYTIKTIISSRQWNNLQLVWKLYAICVICGTVADGTQKCRICGSEVHKIDMLLLK